MAVMSWPLWMVAAVEGTLMAKYRAEKNATRAR